MFWLFLTAFGLACLAVLNAFARLIIFLCVWTFWLCAFFCIVLYKIVILLPLSFADSWRCVKKSSQKTKVLYSFKGPKLNKNE